MTQIEGNGREDVESEKEKLAAGGGVGVGMGEESSFEPEEDPESVPDEGATD